MNSSRACQYSRRWSSTPGRLLLPLLFFWGCNTAPAPGAKPEPSPEAASSAQEVQVAAALLESGRITLAVATLGSRAGLHMVPGEVGLGAGSEAEVGALVSGRIASLEVAEGSRVRSGQVLAWIDAPEVGALRADLARSEALIAAANRRLERQKALQNEGATSQSAFDDAETAARTALADRTAVRARLSSLGAGPDSAVNGRVAVRSPIDGIVAERHATLGAPVYLERTLFRVVNPEAATVYARWSEMLGVPPDAGAEVQLALRGVATAKLCSARVLGSLGLVQSGSRAVTVRVEPAGPCPGLVPGGYVDVLVPQGAAGEGGASRVQVPSEAVVDVRGVPTVFVALGAPGHFAVRAVLPGLSLGGMTTIESGVAAEERVAVRGVILLKGEVLRDVLGGE